MRARGMLILLLWPVVAAADPGLPAETAGSAKAKALVPDPDYVPKVGDRAVLCSPDSAQLSSDLWCATTSQACKDFIKGLLSDSKDATDRLTAAKAIVYLEPRTEVQVLVRESFQVDAGEGEPPLPCTCLAVMVQSGPSRGKTLYTMDYHVTRLIESRDAARPGGGNAGEPASRLGAATAGEATPGSVPVPVGAARDLPAPSRPPGTTETPPDRTVNEILALPSTAVDAPRPAQGSPTPAESGGVISLDSLVPVREPAPARAPAHTQAAEPPAPVEGVISLDSLAPPARRQPAPAPAATPAPEGPRVITLESPGTTATPPPPPAPAPARAEEARAVPPARTVAPSQEVISLDSLAPSVSPAPPPPAAPAHESPRRPVQVAPAQGLPASPPPAQRATVPSRPRRAIAVEPATGNEVVPARPTNPPEPAPVARRAERLAPDNPPPPVQAPAPPPLSAAGMLATALENDRQGKRVEALARYRSLVNSHPGTSQAKWAATRIAALTGSLEVDAQEARAAIVLKRAADLEASGEVTLALTYFRQIVKVYPRTPSARTATDRIKALGGEVPRRPAR